jgi:hypothetical protein
MHRITEEPLFRAAIGVIGALLSAGIPLAILATPIF